MNKNHNKEDEEDRKRIKEAEDRRRKERDDEDARRQRNASMGDMLNTGIPGGIDMDISTPW